MGEGQAQHSYALRCEWALQGAAAVGDTADVVIVVDVLSFTTTVSVTADAGVQVLPFPAGDASAAGVARQRGAYLAGSRSAARAGELSLSPASLRAAPVLPDRLLLPSPNGSAICHALAQRSAVVLAGCLRNASAVAAAVACRWPPPTGVVAVVAAGERWPDGSLRVAAEDLWGAGAVIAALRRRGWADLSPEAEVAEAAHGAVAGDVRRALHGCASGPELRERGYAGDVVIAAEADRSAAVPRLVGDAFIIDLAREPTRPAWRCQRPRVNRLVSGRDRGR